MVFNVQNEPKPSVNLGLRNLMCKMSIQQVYERKPRFTVFNVQNEHKPSVNLGLWNLMCKMVIFTAKVFQNKF